MRDRALRDARAARAEPRPGAAAAAGAARDPALVERAADYAGTYTAPDGASLRVVDRADRLALVDGGKAIALYPRGPDLFWADDPKIRALISSSFGRDRNGASSR